MREMIGTIPVLSLPMFDPGRGRVELSAEPGSSIADIVAQAFPCIIDLARLRVTLMQGDRIAAPPHKYWHRIYPHAGTRVVVRVVPEGDKLRPILQVVVTVAAYAIGTALGGPLLGSIVGAAVGAALITAGVAILGNLLINALVPPRSNTPVGSFGGGVGQIAPDTADQAGVKTSYSINGWQNRAAPGGVIPLVLGELRYSPPFAAPSYTEIYGDNQYVRGLLTMGYGEIDVSAVRFGETPIGSFSEVQTETRTGLVADTPVTLYQSQVIEDGQGVELVYEPARDSLGNYTGSPIAQFVSRFTASDASGAICIFNFPAGLIQFDDQGVSSPVTVSIVVRYRKDGAGSWTTLNTLNVQAERSDGFFRSHTFSFATRGTYEVEVYRSSVNSDLAQISDKASYVALQTLRPEYPVNMGTTPIALYAMRVKATRQLNSSLDDVNMLLKRVCLDWDSGTQTWISRATSNPASLYRFMLQSNANSRPVADSQIDLVRLQSWHEWCDLKGLHYKRVHDFESSAIDVMTDICAAGRATPSHDGEKFSVVIDWDQLVITDHANDRNARDMAWKVQYVAPPDGFRVQFLDETNDYKPAERIIPWPGFAGTVEKAEQLDMPGITNPAQIWIEARRRQYEAIYRRVRYTFVQEGAARTATRGDWIKTSFSTLERVQTAFRAKSINGNVITVDGTVAMVAGTNYAIRYRTHVAGQLPASVLRTVKTVPGESGVVVMTGTGTPPDIDEIIHFGPSTLESGDMIVHSVEMGENMSSVMHCIARASQIDVLTDAEVAPAWNGRVGTTGAQSTAKPPVPVISSIRTLSTFDGFQISIEPGQGGTIAVLEFIVEHKLTSSGTWSSQTILAGTGGLTVTGYSSSDALDLRLTATGTNGVDSDVSAVINYTIGAADPAPDTPISATALGGLGKADLTITAPTNSNLANLIVYRGSTPTFGSATKIATIPGYPSSTISYTDGDGTRATLLTNGSFATDTDWTKGTGWAIASGLATKTAGSASDLTQAISFATGKVYRYSIAISGRTAGAITVSLQGGTDVNSASLNADGQYIGSLTALTGNITLAIVADSVFDGSIDNLILFEETAACAPQGTNYYFVTAVNGAETESSELAISAVTII